MYVCSYNFSSAWVAELPTFWERAAHSVDHMFSLYQGSPLSTMWCALDQGSPLNTRWCAFDQGSPLNTRWCPLDQGSQLNTRWWALDQRSPLNFHTNESGMSTERVKMTKLLQQHSPFVRVQVDSMFCTMSIQIKERTTKRSKIFGYSSNFLKFALCVYLFEFKRMLCGKRSTNYSKALLLCRLANEYEEIFTCFVKFLSRPPVSLNKPQGFMKQLFIQIESIAY